MPGERRRRLGPVQGGLGRTWRMDSMQGCAAMLPRTAARQGRRLRVARPRWPVSGLAARRRLPSRAARFAVPVAVLPAVGSARTLAAYRCGGSSGWVPARRRRRPSRFPFTPHDDDAPRRHQRGGVYHRRRKCPPRRAARRADCDRLGLVNRCPAFARSPGQTGSRCGPGRIDPPKAGAAPATVGEERAASQPLGAPAPGKAPRASGRPARASPAHGSRHSQARIPAWCIWR